jgi:metallophosphoesterase (TIGR00282 family)
MRLLIIGDIVGRPGKHVCSQLVPRLVREQQLDFVLANAENVAAGSGITPAMFNKLRHYGIDACTMGDHIYKRREALPLLESSDRIVRPANLPPEAKGREFAVVPSKNGQQVAIVSVLGRTFMNVRSDCPFHAVDRVLGKLDSSIRHIIVDVHAETTSEKVAMGWYLDGRVAVVVGTHTHVQTADEQILPHGTAYITDLGMTGPYHSVLGRDKDAVVSSLVTGVPQPYTVATEDARLSGVIVETNDEGRALRIERVQLGDPLPMASGDED